MPAPRIPPFSSTSTTTASAARPSRPRPTPVLSSRLVLALSFFMMPLHLLPGVRAQMSIIQPGQGAAAPAPDDNVGSGSGSGSGSGQGSGSGSPPPASEDDAEAGGTLGADGKFVLGDAYSLGPDRVGPTSAATGARYSDLATKGNPFEGSGSNESGAAGTDYAWMFGDDARAQEVNKRVVCRRGCVDPNLDVNLVWCSEVVKYQFCNRTISGPREISVLNGPYLRMENGAISAYMALVRRVPTPNAEECKGMLRKWMCYEFFNRCNNDGTEFYPVCKTTCAAARYACGSPGWIDCDQEVEELEDSAPPEW